MSWIHREGAAAASGPGTAESTRRLGRTGETSAAAAVPPARDRRPGSCPSHLSGKPRSPRASREEADVVVRPARKQASEQFVAEGLGITERGWPQIGQHGRERPDAVIDDLSAAFDQAVREEQQGRSRVKDHIRLGAGPVGSDAERSIRGRRQRADEAIAVDQHRRWMTGIGPAEAPRGGVRSRTMARAAVASWPATSPMTSVCPSAWTRTSHQSPPNAADWSAET
jgi:hypothetical protein